jgi:hypothetical protein
MRLLGQTGGGGNLNSGVAFAQDAEQQEGENVGYREQAFTTNGSGGNNRKKICRYCGADSPTVAFPRPGTSWTISPPATLFPTQSLSIISAKSTDICNSPPQPPPLPQTGWLMSLATIGRFHPGDIANILSMVNMIAKYHVTYDSCEDDSLNEFCVHKGDGEQRKFKQSKRGLFYLNRAETENHIVLTVSTVEGNKSKYADRNYSRAKLACKIQTLVSHPELMDFLRYLDSN